MTSAGAFSSKVIDQSGARPAKRRFRRLPQVIGAILVLLVVLAAGGAAYQAIVSARERELYPPPGTMVEVDSLQMHLACKGEGTPTVILDAGGGDRHRGPRHPGQRLATPLAV